MKIDRHSWIFELFAVVAVSLLTPAQAQGVSAPPAQETGDLSGLHDFDFLVGEWRVHHWIKRPVDGGQWSEFEGSCINRRLAEGRVNVEEHRFARPTGVTYGVAIRSYDPKTAQWAIWWIDSRVPHNTMDPPVVGAFKEGVGTFYSESTLEGEPIRVRFIWSQISPASARWEQAYSKDAGENWETNWIMEFKRVNAS